MNSQPGSGFVPPWLTDWHAKRAAGWVPGDGVLFVSMGVPLAKRYSTVYVPAEYQPDPSHNLSVFAGIGVEIVADIATLRHGRLVALCQAVAHADPYNLLLTILAEPPVIAVLRQGVRHA
ncbi:hypothetical protein [Cupriavidus metallidurans]|uniref:hypothetical protein n=1 Tax=Cupriavidus metallidurans TaxID=119219 RepID=UPI003D0486CB